MTDQVVRNEEDEHVPLHRRLLRRHGHRVTKVKNALLLNNFRLTPAERAEMFARGLAYTQLAIPIGSALYFWWSQTRLRYDYPKQHRTFIDLYFADGYDRFPVHLEHHFGAFLAGVGGLLIAVLVYAAIRKFFRPQRWYLWVLLVALAVTAGVVSGLQLVERVHNYGAFLGVLAGLLVTAASIAIARKWLKAKPWYVRALVVILGIACAVIAGYLIARQLGDLNGTWFPGESAPPWWVIARHRGRRVMIAFVATILIGAFMAGLKERARASTEHMIVSVPVAFIAAMSVAGVLIAFFAWHPVAAGLNQFGLTTNIPVVGDEVAKGAVQSYVIGTLAGIAAKMILARTFFTLQLMSIERNVAQGDEITTFRRIIYGATYVKRFRKIKAEVVAGTRTVKLGNRWIGITASLMAPALFVLFVIGVWLNYIPGSPAYGVH